MSPSSLLSTASLSTASVKHLPHYCIVGGGLSGLSTAFFLSRLLPATSSPSFKLTLLESADRVGGWIESRRDTLSGSIHELGPHSGRAYSPSSHAINRLLEALNLRDSLLWLRQGSPTTRQLLYVNGKLQSPLPVSALPSLLGQRLLARRPFNWRDDVTVDEFFRTRLNDQAADHFGSALVRGIFAGDSRRLGMHACLPRLVNFENRGPNLLLGTIRTALFKQKHPSSSVPALVDSLLPNPSNLVPEKSMAWSMRRGMQQLTDALASDLQSFSNVSIITNTKIDKLSRHQDGRFTVHWNSSDSIQQQIDDVDALFLTCPAHQTSRLLRPLISSQTLNRLDEIHLPWCNVAYAMLEVELGSYIDQSQLPSGFGHLVPTCEDPTVHGTIYDSCVLPELDSPSNQPSRLKRYTVMMNPKSKWVSQTSYDTDAIKQCAIQALRQQVGIKSFKVVDQSIRLLDKCIPQYPVGHLDNIRLLRGEVNDQLLLDGSESSGLYFVGMSYDGVGLSDVVASALNAVCKELNLV